MSIGYTLILWNRCHGYRRRMIPKKMTVTPLVDTIYVRLVASISLRPTTLSIKPIATIVTVSIAMRKGG